VLLLGRVEWEKAWDWLERLGPWAPVGFCLLYAAATVALVPGTLLSLAAGAQWGPMEGLVYVVLASNLGANLAFGIGRFLAREWVARLVSARPKFAAVERAVAGEGWKIVMLLRLSPVFPFNVLNYGLSLTSVRWGDYAWASFVGMLPGTAMIVYLGSLVQAAVKPEGRTPLEWGLFIAGLGATIGVTVLVTRIARRALQERWTTAPSAAGDAADA
jgi:uncharacterized membrane protein YdjX (TVP38/TMEM64 family)